ncbi:50S ribosomal protein L31 [Elusimicrobiota bacterium]
MKKNIHPEAKEATFSCACGATFKAISTKTEVKVEICSNCHPFYTGEQRLIDSAGRVEKFNRRYAKKSKKK